MADREVRRRVRTLKEALKRTASAVRSYATSRRGGLAAGANAVRAARASHAAACAAHDSASAADRAARDLHASTNEVARTTRTLAPEELPGAVAARVRDLRASTRELRDGRADSLAKWLSALERAAHARDMADAAAGARSRPKKPAPTRALRRARTAEVAVTELHAAAEATVRAADAVGEDYLPRSALSQARILRKATRSLVREHTAAVAAFKKAAARDDGARDAVDAELCGECMHSHGGFGSVESARDAAREARDAVSHAYRSSKNIMDVVQTMSDAAASMAVVKATSSLASVLRDLHDATRKLVSAAERDAALWRKASGRTRRASDVMAEASSDVVQTWDGSNLICVIDQEEFKRGDEVVRLPCLHVFHSACITKYMASEKVLMCPLDRKQVSKHQLRQLSAFKWSSHHPNER